MEIPIISSPEIREIEIPKVVTEYYTRTVLPPPVVVNIGLPVVDIPGCVEAHETNNPKNNKIKEDDPSGTYTLCDAGVPSYNPINYNPEEMTIDRPAPVPNTEIPEPPEVEAPEIPKDLKELQCPTEVQKLTQPIGTLVESGTKKITEYRLVGKECIPITEEITITDQIIKGIPSANQVTTTTSIAVVATAAAAATPLLLRVVKPVIKQLAKKIKKLIGKKVEKPSRTEIQSNEYRAKKGLPPLKKK
tara:strand:+ start:55 stop:795 length:741 start_codon:yes stop_codon:yes gene_type:complete